MTLRASYMGWLHEHNPWWADSGAIEEDPSIAAWEASQIRHVPQLFAEMRRDIDAARTVVYTIRGSRQVGKTTMAKMLVRALVREASPWRACYCLMGRGFGARDLVQIVDDYLSMSRAHRGDGRFYVIVDEISMLRGWQDAILELSNAGKLDNCAFVATGSNAVDITRASESLVGRKGDIPGGNHRSLLPMGFLEYASITSMASRAFFKEAGMLDENRREAMWQGLADGREDALLARLCGLSGELDTVLGEYMVTGGIPRVVDSAVSRGTIDDALYRDYLGGIMSEWSGLHGNVDRLGRYVDFLIGGLGSTVTWNGAAGKADLPNAVAAEDYALTLRDMYVALVTRTYNERNGKASPRKPKKVHLRDPFFLHALGSQMEAGGHYARSREHASDPARLGRIAECVLADHLARHETRVAGAAQGIAPPELTFHWRDAAGREVDFVHKRPGLTPVPIEAKYADRVDRRKLGGMASFVDATEATRGIVASRREFDVRHDYTLVPAAVLLALLS